MKTTLLFAFGFILTFAATAHAETASTRTCHVTYYCGSSSGGEIGPFEATAGVEERKCATNSNQVIDSLRGACAVRGTLRVAFAIYGETPPPVLERCNIGFRCPGNSQTLKISAAMSRYACLAGKLGAFQSYKQDIPYFKYHNEFTSHLSPICPPTNQDRNRYSRITSPTNIDSIEWRVPTAADTTPNPTLNCRCYTRCYGSRTGWTDDISYDFSVPYDTSLCRNGDTRERAQAACTAVGSDTWPQSSRLPNGCTMTFATGQLNGTPAAGSTPSATSH